MTIICAIRKHGETWIGADTLAVRGGELSPAPARKWLYADTVAIGCSGSWAFVQALADRLGEFDKDWSPQRFFVWMKKVLADFGSEPKKEDAEAAWFDLSTIFVRGDEIWDIPAGGGPLNYGTCGKICARGVGDEYAVGAAYAAETYLADPKPAEILRIAINAAKCCNDHCGGETWIEKFS